MIKLEENKQTKEETKLIESPNSVKIAVNSKLKWSGEIKVYANNPNIAFTKAVDLGNTLAALIKEKNKESVV